MFHPPINKELLTTSLQRVHIGVTTGARPSVPAPPGWPVQPGSCQSSGWPRLPPDASTRAAWWKTHRYRDGQILTNQ